MIRAREDVDVCTMSKLREQVTYLYSDIQQGRQSQTDVPRELWPQI